MLPALPRGLLHGLIPYEGPLELVLEIALYAGILSAAFALVLLFETWTGTRERIQGTAAILLLPVVGAIAVIVLAYRARRSKIQAAPNR